MQRRRLLQWTLVPLALAFGTGHSPYRQWTVYRQSHLLILTSQAHPPSFELGKRIAAILAERLPSSRARVARAPDLERVASLLASGQIDVALLPREWVAALLAGGAPPGQGPIALRALVAQDDMVLVCRDDFPDRHAYLLAETLLKAGAELAGIAIPVAPAAAALHPGVEAFRMGKPLPPEPSAR